MVENIKSRVNLMLLKMQFLKFVTKKTFKLNYKNAIRNITQMEEKFGARIVVNAPKSFI